MLSHLRNPINKQLIRSTIVMLLFLVTTLQSAFAQADEGKKIFDARCTSCHAVDKKVIGPALAGMSSRTPGEAWIIKWVKNSSKLIASGDAYANKVFNENNKSVMTAFEDLSDKDIKNVIAYVAEAEKAAPPTDTKTAGATASSGIDPKAVYTGLLIIVGVLSIVAFILVFVSAILISVLRVRNGQEPFSAAGTTRAFKELLKNPYFMGPMTLILLSIGGYRLVGYARSVGLHQNYQPVQPIAFSHKLHAGDYAINCNYCHVGAEKGKNATIPSSNICMNCHNYVEQGPKHGKTEIAKVKKHFETNTPVEWVRIHNLPDFVYFNHQQHTKAGGIACQTCHGPIETMEEVYQFSPLSMGWCINCHRETKVDVNKNDYYTTVHDEWVKKKADAKKAGKEVKITVSDLGGLECAKCHY